MENMNTPTVSYANVTSKYIYPKKEQAIVLDSIDGVMLRDYILSLSNVIKPSSIRFISRISNSRICVYMDSKLSADNLVDVIKKVKVKEYVLEIRPLITRNKRIVLSNVCPIIPHEFIVEKFQEMNIKILSPITYMKVGISDPGFSHIMSFRRQLYVSPEDESKLPESMQINFDDTNYWIYITNESMKCFVCNGMGHLAKFCPQSIQSSTQDSVVIQNSNPIEFNIPQTSINAPPAIKVVNHKGVKRIHSSTASEPSQTDLIPITPTALVEERPFSDSTDDTTDGNISVDEAPNNKSLKKKKKTLDHRSEEQVWSDINFELNETKQLSQFPLTLDQFKSLLDVSRYKQNIQELLKDYTDNIPELISMCLYLHPKMNKNLKNRCSRFLRKLQNWSNLQDTP